MRVRWTTPAREQFVTAYEYLAAENRAMAGQIANKIWKGTELLSRHPMAGKAGRVRGTRELVIRGAPFIVAYRVEKNAVSILAVMHAARKWPEEF